MSVSAELPPPSDRFQKQHASLLAQAMEIGAMFGPDGSIADPAACRRALASFAGKLRIHAAMENGALYPRLLAHGDPEIVTLAKGLLDECGAIYDELDVYLARWDASAIAADTRTFARETRRVFRRLGTRMARENDELYPLVDRLCALRAWGASREEAELLQSRMA